MSIQSPSFLQPVVVYFHGAQQSSINLYVPWVTDFDEINGQSQLCVLTQALQAYEAGLYVQVQSVWKLALRFQDVCNAVTTASTISIFLIVSAEVDFPAQTIVWKNGLLQIGNSIFADPTSIWVTSAAPVGGITALSQASDYTSHLVTPLSTKIASSLIGVANGIASLGSDTKVPSPQMTGKLATSDLTDGAALNIAVTANTVAVATKVSTSSLGVASGVATLGSDTKVPTAQMTGKLATTDLTDGAALNTAVTANTTAIATKVSTSLLGVASGVATLDSGGKVPTSQLPASVQGALNYQGAWTPNTSPILISGGGGSTSKGFYYTANASVTLGLAIDGITQVNLGDHIVSNGSVWEKFDGVASEVVSVAGRTGVVTIATTDLTDVASAITTPISNAQSTANTAVTNAATAQTTANAAIPSSQKGAASGVATLGSDTKVPVAQMTGKLATTDLTDGAALNSTVSTNTTNITTNTTNITTNTTNITTNTTNIASNTTAIATKVSTSSIGISGGVAPNGDTVQITGNVTITTGNQATYNGKLLEWTGAYTVTISAGLATSFGFAGIPPSSGNATIASDGTITLNGSTTSLTRAAASYTMFAVAQRSTNANAYVIN